jgi:hypothetical protein
MTVTEDGRKQAPEQVVWPAVHGDGYTVSVPPAPEAAEQPEEPAKG